MQSETVSEIDPLGVFNEVDSVSRLIEPTVVVRHYSFIDFAHYGSAWHPDWFNIVRDPIDKVRPTKAFRAFLSFANSLLLCLPPI